MKIIEPSVEFLNCPNADELYSLIERCGRVCYKSENAITPKSAIPFIRFIINRGHTAVLEHASLTVKFICDRGVSHEIVRHRLASYCQESTRYCNYSKDKFDKQITVIDPMYLHSDNTKYLIWQRACEHAEISYFDLLDLGCTPQEARAVLPNSLKTEVVMTANIREWRHFLKLRTSPAAHPQMRQVALLLQDMLVENYPALFEDLV